MFKERLKEIRTENNVKQVELANFLGVRNTTVSAWETGDNEPDLTTVVKIARYFHVTTDYLLGMDDLQNDSVFLLLLKQRKNNIYTRRINEEKPL